VNIICEGKIICEKYKFFVNNHTKLFTNNFDGITENFKTVNFSQKIFFFTDNFGNITENLQYFEI
jgi:hypothetical protein